MALKYITQKTAQEIDVKLMSAEGGFSIDQLMELAGLSVASAINEVYAPQNKFNALICCGPGNNGGDGLVAAGHLFHFGFKPEIFYPKRSSKDLYERLIKRCENLNIPFINDISRQDSLLKYDLIVDGIFGFGFKGDVREPFDKVLSLLSNSTKPIVSIDVPSGWDVEKGNVNSVGFEPEMLVSLSAPKLCAKHFKGKYHYLGGRFIPPSLAHEFELNLPEYQGSEQHVKL